MSYAIKNDDSGWRAVTGPDDVGPDETYSQDQPTAAGPTLGDLKALKIDELNVAAAETITPITSVYSQAERDTWPIQEAEAAAWTADAQAATPMLDAIATQRGMAKADLVASVAVKAAEFKALAGATFGKRRALVDQVNAAATAEDVAAISW